MSLKIGRKQTPYLHDTEVENLFIAEYMAEAPGDFVKVYLYSLMLAQNDIERSSHDVAKALALTEEQVERAFLFFEDMGLLEQRGDEIRFLSLKEKLYSVEKEPPKVRGVDDYDALAEEEEYDLARINAALEAMSEEEVELRDDYEEDLTKEKDAADEMRGIQRNLLNNEAVSAMTVEIQNITGRFIGPREKEYIVLWINDMGLSPGLIVKGYEYAKKRGTDNYKYVAKVVEDWAKKGLRTTADVDEYLTDIDERHYTYKRIMKALGFLRTPTEEEERLMDAWLDELNCSLEEILEACAKTAGIGNPNFNYVNAVIRNKKGVSQAGMTRGGASRQVVQEYYAKLREEAQEKARKLKEEVFAKVPEIGEIEEKLVSANRDLTLAIVQGDPRKRENIGALKEEINRLERRKDYLLTDNDIPVDYMNVRYRCRICSDTGVTENGEQCQCYMEIAKEAEERAAGA